MNTSEERLYDLSLLEEMAQGDTAFMKEIAETFVSTVPPVVEAMVAHCKIQDWKQMSSEAHNLKSNIDTLQIQSIREDIRIIELNGKQGIDLDITPDIVARVEDILLKAIAQLKAEYNL